MASADETTRGVEDGQLRTTLFNVAAFCREKCQAVTQVVPVEGTSEAKATGGNASATRIKRCGGFSKRTGDGTKGLS